VNHRDIDGDASPVLPVVEEQVRASAAVHGDFCADSLACRQAHTLDGFADMKMPRPHTSLLAADNVVPK